MDNNELPQANREELLAQIENNLKAIELLEAEVKTLSWTDETLYRLDECGRNMENLV